MRESTISYPLQNRAVKQVPNYYDRASINCPSIIPLLNSLNQLIFLTSTSAGAREQIVKDGGLEQLIHILNTTKIIDIRTGWKWSMAYQCVVNIGVRGNEHIRKRVVESGIIPIVINILDTFLNSLMNIKNQNELYNLKNKKNNTINNSRELAFIRNSNSNSDSALNLIMPNLNSEQNSSSFILSNNNNNNNSQNNNQNLGLFIPEENERSSSENTNNVTLSAEENDEIMTGYESENEEINNNSPPEWLDKVLYREEDILLSLQLLAYLSKYPNLRQILHTGYEPVNVFQLVEMFTSRVNATQVQHWSGIIMRNACRKDEARGGLRRCAFMSCGKWETCPREFAKCRRCRKAKYCSKTCQSRAWTEGHRYWCIERTADAQGGDEVAQPNTNEDQINQVTAQLSNQDTELINNGDQTSHLPERP
ncbi:hypothetical protein K502DRAFT_312405 [Neoconidiobolus thromboides FSU 785]|nr:hypothetical protein K502DRAFT_312405 [Neoconidiobolus thromboides FSU 785]